MRLLTKHLLVAACIHLLCSDQQFAVYAADPNPQPTQSADQPSQTPTQAKAPAKPKTPAPIKLLAEEDYWIDPDRPHITDSSVSVPKGLWLQENGFQQTFYNPHSNAFDFPETLIRLGIASRLELRYNTPNFFTSAVTAQTPNGQTTTTDTTFQNMQAGFKARLGPLGPTKFELAANPYISIPTGFTGQSSHIDPNIKFPFSQRLNKRWDIEGMQSFFDPFIDGRRNLDWQSCILINRFWGRKSNVFVEYVSDVFQHGRMSNLIHFGAAYRPTRRQQFDVQFGFRLNNEAPIAFFGFGYSFLLGNLKRPELTPSMFRKEVN
jgi:hypothetical protein